MWRASVYHRARKVARQALTTYGRDTVTDYFGAIWDEAAAQFTEDNVATRRAFLQEHFDKAIAGVDAGS